MSSLPINISRTLAISGTPPKTHQRILHSHSVRPSSASLLFEEPTSPAHAGAFFAELADTLVAPAFAHRLAFYVGYDGPLVRLLAGLGIVPLR